MDNDYSCKKRFIAMLKFALLLFVILGIPLFLYIKYGPEIYSKDSAKLVIEYLKAHKEQSVLLMIAIQTLQVIICILPGQPIQFASSYMFGIAVGFALSITGAIIGAAISYYLAKILGADILHIIFNKDRIEDYRNKLNSGKSLIIAFLIYLIPGVPKDLVAYVAGISDMKFKSFMLVSSIGRCPGMLGSLLFGHFYGIGDYEAIIILSIIAASILVICVIFRKKIMKYLNHLESKG